MELQITIDWNNVEGAVRKHLSIIGKRQKDSDGILFAGVTLSTEEEKVLKQYINAAAEVFVSELAPLVTYYNSGDFLIFKVKNTRWADDENGVSVPFEGNFMGYVVAYVVNTVLSMNYPELAKKYELDKQVHLNSAIKLIFTKTPPSAPTKTLKDMTGEVQLDNENNKSDKA